jgi:transposase
MSRVVLTDSLWTELEAVMRSKGCKKSKNNRNVMEAILWKLRTGAQWREVPEKFCPWSTAYNRFNRWAEKGLWDEFFLSYEKKLIRSGYQSMEVTYGLISMLVELGVENIVRLEEHPVDPQQKYTWPPMRMETRTILKSLGVRSTTAKLRRV